MTTNQTNNTTNEQAKASEQPKAATPQETTFDWKGFAKTAGVAAAGAAIGAAGMWAWNHFTE